MRHTKENVKGIAIIQQCSCRQKSPQSARLLILPLQKLVAKKPCSDMSEKGDVARTVARHTFLHRSSKCTIMFTGQASPFGLFTSEWLCGCPTGLSFKPLAISLALTCP